MAKMLNQLVEVLLSSLKTSISSLQLVSNVLLTINFLEAKHDSNLYGIVW